MSLGPELVVNGGFDTDSDWVKGEGWTIADGKAVLSLSDSADTTIYQPVPPELEIGKTYRVSFEISNSVGLGGIPGGPYIVFMIEFVFTPATLQMYQDGTYSFDAICIAVPDGDNLYFTTVGTEQPFTCSFNLDDVSVREVLADGGLSGVEYLMGMQEDER